jgi:hypothetical protein
MLSPRHRTAITLAALAAGCLLGTACGGAAQAGTGDRAAGSDRSITSTRSRAQWSRQANQICTRALPDDGHEMVNHLDEAHIKRHGMAIVMAGSALEALGPPAGADAGTYKHMLALYESSAVRHGLALRELGDGNDGNAAMQYSLALAQADQADRLAARFGASACARFGMTG